MSGAGLRSVEDQLERVLAAVRQHPPVRIRIEQTLGRTLAADVHAGSAVPAFDNSAMDGFAVHFADVSAASEAAPAVLQVIADVPAGSAADPAFGPGEAVRIMTGAPVPTGASERLTSARRLPWSIRASLTPSATIRSRSCCT